MPEGNSRSTPLEGPAEAGVDWERRARRLEALCGLAVEMGRRPRLGRYQHLDQGEGPAGVLAGRLDRVVVADDSGRSTRPRPQDAIVHLESPPMRGPS